jgi:shikimate kinase
MNIVLIGYRGTGKTTVGKALSQRLHRPFFDADVLLEEKEGRTIGEMVAKEGWPFFRAKEKEAIGQLSGQTDCVIATGGGAVMDSDNVACLRRNGLLVLLKAELETMVQRMQRDAVNGQERPGLLGGDIYHETQTMIRQRMPVYLEVADFSVDTTDLSVERVVDAIVTFMQASGMKG